MWGVSEKNIFDAQSFKATYGIVGTSTKDKYWYPISGGHLYYKYHNGISKEHFLFKEGEIDMLLDVDKGELKFRIVGQSDDKHEAKLYNLPKQMYGWVPHFNCYDGHTELRIAKISVKLYGKPINDIFS